MTTPNIGSVSESQIYPTGKPSSQLDMSTFLRLLTTQLSNQNPLEPMNDRDFFAQMAQLGQVQGMNDIKKSLEVSEAAGIIGKTVTAVRMMTEGASNNNELVQGVATKLTFRNGEYFLGLTEADGGTVDVKVANIQTIEG